jgi:hypothetical protein
MTMPMLIESKLGPNELPKRIKSLLTKAGIPIEKMAIIRALKTGKLYVYHWPANYGKYTHRDVCQWAGVDPMTLPMTWPDDDAGAFPDIGLSYRAWRMLKRAGIPATKEAITNALKTGDLLPGKRPGGYGKITHAEICRWVGVDPTKSKLVMPSAW